MGSAALDPYEQQLLTVFASYDYDNLGSLDESGLTQLCQTLQLEEQGSDLIQCLLKDPNHSRATFPEFRDALLTLLDTMQKHTKTIDDIKQIENGSPDREVSPKFVYGSKKYGRRSRPRSEEICALPEEEEKSPVAVQRSNSQTEVSNSKKRKTNYKLKRCTSLPGTQRIFDSSFTETAPNEVICTEEMLREAWKKLGVGEDGFLNQTELVLVCDAIGLHNLAKGVIRQLSDKLTMDYDHRISFQELLEALQEDETWSEVLTPTNELTLNMSRDFPDSRTFQFMTLGPNGDGLISADNLIEMWEAVGITAPKELIHELGFNAREISVRELAAVLDKEIKGLNDCDVQNPHMALLQANLSLYQSEIRCLKNILEQMHAEREKLKCDVYEANNRAKLLAQEVDDNHVKTEINTQNQVKLLEQRHSDILKEISSQYTNDKEQLSNVNLNLEEKIRTLEHEIIKLKNDLVVAQRYSSSLEKENQTLSNQITELKEVKGVLTNQIAGFENDKQKYVEMERKQMEPLLSKLSDLQVENAQLRDRNDEMVTEIESLTSQVSSMRVKVANTPTYNTLHQCMDEKCEGVGLGAKRRSDYSPTKDDVLFGIANGSPRLGKVRKFQLDVVPFSSNESGFEAESLEDDNSEEITKLRAKIAFLEQVLTQHSIPVPEDVTGQNTTPVSTLRNRIQHLEGLFGEIGTMLQRNDLSSDNLKVVNEKLKSIMKSVTEQASPNYQSLEETIQQYQADNEKLSVKCTELEQCVELLKTEYEKCEDYWQTKLEEERQIFEAEQSQSTEKLTDLINKMAEYEEQFSNQDNRLPTIEETFNLEKQFTDLEQEYDEFRTLSENEIFKRDEEISILKQKLTELASERRPIQEVAVQVDDSRIASKMNNLTLCVVETTNLFSADAAPNWHDPKKPEREFVNPSFVWNKESKSPSTTPLSWQQSTQASTSNSSSLEKNGTPCRPKRTRKHERNNCVYRKNETKKDEGSKREQQMVALPVITVHNLNGRLHHLEQRCRQLQMVLKQQIFHTDQVLQQCWQQHQGEKVELQCMLRSNQEKIEQQARVCNEQLERLARSDMLVKELYVENSYLIAKVQRLEQQCHILAQCSANSSV